MVILRAATLVIFLLMGYGAGVVALQEPAKGALAGLALGIVALLVEALSRRVKVGRFMGAIVGLALGLLMAWLLIYPLRGMLGDKHALIRFAVGAVLGYAGMLIGVSRGEKLTVTSLHRTLSGKGAAANVKLLDTSAIIDGRIADVCETSFLEGDFIVPQFILHELQYVADSPDPLKRARGRRGLEILQRIQKMPQISVSVVEDDFPKIREVDAKLVALAQEYGAKIITTDFNLNKVAELQGVTVLNINDLANSIKPVVLPGETFRVFIIKEGKEPTQGVAYLEDGTMVVVDNGRRLIGRNVDVTVTSVLQTTAGRMIFTKTREEYEREEGKSLQR